MSPIFAIVVVRLPSFSSISCALPEEVLAEEVLNGIAETNENFKAIYDDYYRLLNPKMSLSGDGKRICLLIPS